MTHRMGTTAGYPIVDADTHVTEPADLWQMRLPAKFRDEGPKVIEGPLGGLTWLAPNGKTMALSRLVNTGGLAANEWDLIPKDGYDRMLAGGWDPAARIADM